MADGPRPAWTWSTPWPTSPRWRTYHLLPSVRADLLAKLGRTDEAAAELRPGRRAGDQRAGAGAAPARAEGLG